MYSWFSPRSPHTVSNGKAAVCVLRWHAQTTHRHFLFFMRSSLTLLSLHSWPHSHRNPNSDPVLVLMWTHFNSPSPLLSVRLCVLLVGSRWALRQQTQRARCQRPHTSISICVLSPTHTHISSMKPVPFFTPPRWPRRMKSSHEQACPFAQNTFTHTLWHPALQYTLAAPTDLTPPLFVVHLCTSCVGV